MSRVKLSLGELIHVKHGYAFKGEYFSDNGKFILLTPGNCHEKGGLKLKGEKEKYYAGDVPDDFILNQGDMLVVMTDLINTAPILGGAFYIPNDNVFLHNQRLGLVQIKDSSKISKRYLYYILNWENYRGQIRGSATGATVRHTAPERIYKCSVEIPKEISAQEKIADVLSGYDELIENNLQRIELLEESARLLYREWFAYLRFPGHEHTKITNGVPVGWGKKTLIEIADLTMGQSPKSKYYNEDGEGLPFHQGVTNFSTRFVSHKTYCSVQNRIAEEDDILCSVRAPVGRLNITLDKIVIGRGLSAIRSKTKNQSLLYYQLRSHFFREDIIGTGVIYASTTRNEMQKQEFLQPEKKLVDLFEDISIPIDKQIKNLFIQNQNLIKARDILLPRLMNGEITV